MKLTKWSIRSIGWLIGVAAWSACTNVETTAMTRGLKPIAPKVASIASELQIQVGSTSPYIGECVELKVTRIDGSSSPVSSVVDEEFLVTGDTSKVRFYKDSSCSIKTETLNIANGQSSVTLYLRRISADDASVLVSGTSLRSAITLGAKPMLVERSPKFVLGQSNANALVQYDQLSDGVSTVASIGSQLVATSNSYRVMFWNTRPAENQAQPSFNWGFQLGVSSVGGNGFKTPATDGTRFAIVDNGNHRVLLFNKIASSQFDAADVVLGQKTMKDGIANSGGLSSSSMYNPFGVAFVGDSKIAIADYRNHRVLIYNSWPTSNFQAADVILGQPDGASNVSNNGGVSAKSLSYPVGICSDGVRFAVVDQANSRILIWNSVPTSTFTNADVVVGQLDFATNIPGLSASKFNQPRYCLFSGGKLIVSDSSNHRVLVYNSAPASSGVAADLAIGQPSLTANTANNGGISEATLNSPGGIAIHEGDLYIADQGNRRLLRYMGIPVTSGSIAQWVWGQPNFTSSTNYRVPDPSGTNFMRSGPYLYANSRLYIGDGSRHRILVFDPVGESDGQSASFALGQSSLTAAAANGGSSVNGAAFNSNEYMIKVGQKFFVADGSNNRVLVWNAPPATAQTPADYAIGQNNLTTNTAGVSTTKFNYPTGIASDGVRLVVSDYNNNRVLIWNSIPLNGATPADVVLGQDTFTSNTANAGGLSASSLSGPYHAEIVDGKILVNDYGNQRVLVWNSWPVANKQNADVVIGRSSFIDNSALTPTRQTVVAPYGIIYYRNRLLIADFAARRIMGWNSVPVTNGAPADFVWGQLDFNSNWMFDVRLTKTRGFGGGGGFVDMGNQLGIGDYMGHRLLVFDNPFANW